MPGGSSGACGMRGYYRSTVNLRLGLRYDLRGPAEPERLYPAILEHAALADAVGFDALWISERPFARAAGSAAAPGGGGCAYNACSRRQRALAAPALPPAAPGRGCGDARRPLGRP